MIENESKLLNCPTQTAAKQQDKHNIYIPTEVSRDSTFLFKADEKIKIKIDPNKRGKS